ncbi:MAG: glycosyltransferase [Bacteroidaceae bacterium]|nr:glycosyltransferase [Bacteroidaceae bacterium]
MKILFVVDKLFNKQDATVGIAKTLTKEWQKMGHEVVYLCNTLDAPKTTGNIDCLEFEGVNTYQYEIMTENYLKDFLKSLEGLGKAAKIRTYITHPGMWGRIYDFYFAEYKKYAFRVAEHIEQLYKKENFDLIYSISEPHYSAFAVALAKIPTTCRKRCYLGDPYSHNDNHDYKRARKVEKYILWTVEKVFTSKNILASYEKDEYFKDYLRKIEAVEFPTFVKPEELEIPFETGFDSSKINCVYAGNLFYEMRNPKNMLELFCQMKGPVLHIFGTGCEELVEEYVNKSEGHIIHHGKVAPEQVPQVLNQADILVNLSSTIPNMVPSKLFQYFATGKPILNMCYLKDCPTQEYTAKHPMAFNIFGDSFDPNQVRSFCENNRGKVAGFDAMKEIYGEASPEYVAAKLLPNENDQAAESIQPRWFY